MLTILEYKAEKMYSSSRQVLLSASIKIVNENALLHNENYLSFKITLEIAEAVANNQSLLAV